jgi:hypothetical protein
MLGKNGGSKFVRFYNVEMNPFTSQLSKKGECSWDEEIKDDDL